MTHAYASTVIDAPVEHVWRHLRDFGNIDAYYAPTEIIDVDGPGDQVGCIRTARHRETGQVFREQLLALSDVEHYASYNQLQSRGLRALIARNHDSPLPARGKSSGNGRTS